MSNNEKAINLTQNNIKNKCENCGKETTNYKNHELRTATGSDKKTFCSSCGSKAALKLLDKFF